MANYQVNATQLTHGSVVFIRGTLGFARLTRLIEGADLAARDRQNVSRGMSPVGQPHTTATIAQAEVLYQDKANPTLEERFVEERRYDSKKNPNSGKHYTIASKGSTLPIIAIPSDAGDGTVVQDTSGRELDNGLNVTLVLRVYKPKNYAQHGLALEQVIVNEPVRYYGGRSSVSPDALQAAGIVYATPPQAVKAGSATGVGETAPVEADEDNLPLPQPAATPAPAAVPVVPAAPAGGSKEDLEAQVAKLQAQIAAQQGGQSAVGDNPWADESADAQRTGIYPG